MCEDLSFTSYSSVRSAESEDTMRFVDSQNNVDVGVLKSRLKETSLNRESHSLISNTENGSEKTDNGYEQDQVSISSFDGCSSKNLEEDDVTSDHDSSNQKEDAVSDSECDIKKENGAAAHHNKCYSEPDNYNPSRLRSGLLITPITLTQDIPVDIGGSNNRLSTVLEKIQQPLVYIPTTRQLVARKNNSGSETSRSNSESGSQGNPGAELSSGVTEPISLSEHDSNQSTSTETILNIDDNDFNSDSVKQNILETSSLGETDSLLRLKEPDQLTCSSFELEPGLHRVQTGDSLLRTFNDASSLSSLSTCTDFSVSAASIGDDGEGTGLCIDTGDGGFMEINLHSRNSFERCKTCSQDSGIDDKGAKPKRRGISGFLSR